MPKPRQGSHRLDDGNRLIRMDAWMDDAACASDDPVLYDEMFEKKPPSGISCGGCIVRGQCFTFAVRNNYEGVWGGTTHKQRLTMARRQRRAKCPDPDCRSTEIRRGGNHDVCGACGLSWPTVKPRVA